MGSDLHQVGHWMACVPFDSVRWTVVLIAGNTRVLEYEDNGLGGNEVVVGSASMDEDIP